MVKGEILKNNRLSLINECMSAYSDTLWKTKIITSWADERIEDEWFEMKYEWQTGQLTELSSQFQGVSPVEGWAKEDKNEEMRIRAKMVW